MQSNMHIIYRRLEKEDNPVIAALIRTILEEFHIDRPGTAYTDPTTDDLFSLFAVPRSIYYVAQKEGILVGGCGIFPTNGLPGNLAITAFILKQCLNLGMRYAYMKRRGLSISLIQWVILDIFFVTYGCLKI